MPAWVMSCHLPWEVHRLVGPKLAHHLDLLGAAGAAVLEVHAQGLVLNEIPADADAKAQPAATENVYLGGLLGHQRRLPLRQDEDAGHQAHAGGYGGQVAHSGQRLMHHRLVVVHTEEGMVIGAGVRAEDVVGDEQVGVAHILGGLGEVADGHHVRLDFGLGKMTPISMDAPLGWDCMMQWQLTPMLRRWGCAIEPKGNAQSPYLLNELRHRIPWPVPRCEHL